jgi:AcrR family transcriptional regulator
MARDDAAARAGAVPAADPVSSADPVPATDPAAGHGRGLDSSRDALITDAALALVGELGYDNVSMDAIAGRARVSKATIYRRWDSKAALVAHAMGARKGHLPELPDTGDFRQDLIEGLTSMIDHTEADDLALMTGLLTAMRSDPELARLIREQMVTNKRSASRDFIARAVERGQLPPAVDHGVLDEIAPAIIFNRLILTGESVDLSFVTHLVDDVLLPVLFHSAHPAVPVSS